MTSSVKLSSLIRDQIPGHVRSNYQTFVKFLEYYYEWLEGKTGPADVIRNWDEYRSIYSSVDEFVDEIKNEVLPSIPNSVLADKRRLARHAREFYKTKGTARSFEFLFRILFNEDIELYYPKENVFRLSDGNWVKNDTVLVTTSLNNTSDLIYKKIRQTRVINEFQTEEASAVVVKAQRATKQQIEQTVLYLNDVKGEFKGTHPIYVEDSPSTVEFLYPIISNIKVISGGNGYLVGEKIAIEQGAFWTISEYLNETKRVDLRITSLLSSEDIQVQVNDSIVSDFDFDGRYVYLPNYESTSRVTVTLQSKPGYAVVSQVNEFGEILEIKIHDFPFGFSTVPGYTVESSGGAGAVLELETGYVGYAPGHFKNTKGMLSSTNYLHDSNYYQDFSYVIRALRSIDTYGNIVKKLLHPAGMKLFGEIRIHSFIALIIRDLKCYIDFEIPDQTLVINTSESLHSRVSSFDRHKLTFQELDVWLYQNTVISDIFDNYKTKWDFTSPVYIEHFDD